MRQKSCGEIKKKRCQQEKQQCHTLIITNIINFSERKKHKPTKTLMQTQKREKQTAEPHSHYMPQHSL